MVKAKLSVIIAVYNERNNLEEVYKRINKVPWGRPVEVLWVDDGSVDGSRELLKKLQKKKSGRVENRFVYKDKNEGKGSAIAVGIKKVRGDWVAIQDADLEYHPSQISELVNLAEKNGHLAVYGTRNAQIKNKYLYPHFFWGAKVLYFFINFFYGLELSDPETCQKVFRRNVLNFEIEEKGFGVEVELTAKVARQGVGIVEFPIRYFPRGFGEGKKIKAIDGMKAFWQILKYWL